MWNNFISPFFRADVGVGQGFALSSILSTLYITPIFHIFEKRSKNHILNIVIVHLDLNIFISFLFIFLDLIFLLFCFCFCFSWMMKRHMTMVT